MTQKKKKKPTPSVGFFHVSMFCLLSHLCLLLPYFSSFPFLLDFSKPKSGPSNEVIGIYIYAGNLTGWVAFRLEDVRETEGEKQN